MRPLLIATLALALLVLPVVAGAQVPTYEGTVTAAQANVRARPSLQSPVVKVLPKGTVMRILGKEEAWYRVTLPDAGQDGDVAFVHESIMAVKQLAGGIPAPAASALTGSPTAEGHRAAGVPSPNTESMPGYRDPGRARFFSYFAPGGGHLYSGEFGKAAQFIGIGVGGAALGVYMSNYYEGVRRDLEYAELGAVVECIGNVISTFFCNYPGVPKYIGLGLLGLAWLGSIGDAGESAERMNAKNGLVIQTAGGTLTPVMTVGHDNQVDVGLAITWGQER